MKTILMIILFSCLLSGSNFLEREFVKEYSKGFKIPIWYINNFSFAESSQDTKKISHKDAIGLFQVREILLEHYLKIAGFNIKNIKDIKKFLMNEKNNTYIFCYMTAFWRRRGYNLKQIAQIWLFGETGFKRGSYSIKFENKIFRNNI